MARLRPAMRGVETTSRSTPPGSAAGANPVVSTAAGAIPGTATRVRATGTNRLMMTDRYRTGRSATYSTVRVDRASSRAGSDTSAGLSEVSSGLPLATIWYSEGTVSRLAAVA